MDDHDGATFQARSAGYLANHLARLFAQELAEAIRPLGLAPAQFMVLLELWSGDGLTQADLVTRADVEQATMANTLGRMERDGFIVRTTHPEDSRAQVIRLTPHARGLRPAAMAAAKAVNARALGDLSASDVSQALALMGRMVANLRAGRAKPRTRRPSAAV